MNKEITVGIVGSQFAAMLHAESYKRLPWVKIKAMAALDNLDKFGDTYHIPVTGRYKSYQEMFEKEKPDLISVCVPNFLHKDVVLSAVKAGLKNIICEKPLASNVTDGRAMVKAQRE